MKLFILFTALIVFTACKYQLTDAAKDWNPYKTGDILVFESNNKQSDTFFIGKIEESFTGKNEILNVKYRYLSKADTSQKKADTIHTFFIALTAWEKERAFFSLNFYTPRAKFIPFVAKSISWLDSLPVSKIATYTNVLTLTPDSDRVGELNQSDSTLVGKVYWSKAEGLIGYTLKNNDQVWLLKRKYSL